MKIPKKGSEKTCNNLLAVASEIFAEKGYRDATIAEISRRAGTNIAAVNYHFGDKETLYREAWRHSFLKSIKAHPPDGGVSAEAPPEERLRGQVVALLHRIADKNNKEFLFVQKEFANPTGLLEEVMQKEIRPLHERTRAVIRELLGPHIPDMLVQFCEISIISQCLNPMVVRRDGAGKREPKKDRPEIEDIEAYAEYVVKFSLGGIGVIRREAEKEETSFKIR
jgi:AcrR family transcriptional regulator